MTDQIYITRHYAIIHTQDNVVTYGPFLTCASRDEKVKEMVEKFTNAGIEIYAIYHNTLDKNLTLSTEETTEYNDYQ